MYGNVPYCGPTSEQLRPGSIIQAKGQSQPDSNFFAISLQCGSSLNFNDDVALYLSLAFSPPPRIIRNSLISGQWGPEESFGGFPTNPGAPFEILISIEPNEYRIAINGQHFTEYHHRLPFERITHVSLTGDARIDSFSIWYTNNHQMGSSSGNYPGLYPPIPSELAAPPPYNNPGYGFEGQQGGMPPYPTGQIPYPTGQAPYPSGPQYPQAYPPSVQPSMPGNYPNQQPYYPTASGSSYPYDQQESTKNKSSSGGGGIGNMLGGALTGVAGGIATHAISKKLFGKHHSRSMVPGIVSGVAGNVLSGGGIGGGHHPKHKHKKSSAAIPIAGLAAGAGAAALGATLLGKAFKHKHKGSWSHKGWGGRHSSSSSSSEEEE
ncbi:Galectin [Dermatophagoides pteronyssinus]|uniref:Galectin n=1 Tax=Dermatophagoides pteronyssinus TaxID=6956 RepID=A0ABQ8JKV6_DERPT|nr:Galectin [Dermatophagoides pteronyssinus]